MRTLTDAEARVVGALLGSTLLTERARLQRAGVPRSTYHAARRRAYGEGWIRDRYIPNPVEFGLPFVAFVVARPFAERLGSYIQDRSRDGGVIFLASSPQLSLCIGWYPTESDAQQSAELANSGGYASWSFPLVADSRGPSIPAYFDFEGSFAHFGDFEGAEGYPQGIGGAAPAPTRSPPDFGARRQSWAPATLIHRPFEGAEGGRPSHRVGPLGLPWGQRRLLNQGWVSHRVLLEPAALPPFRGRSAQQQVFVVGTMKPERRPEELFAALTRDCRVYPFLFVAEGGRLLIGALGQPPNAPPVGDASPGRKSVMGVLRERLEGIEILQEPAELFRTQVDHRYDRLVAAPPGRPTPSE